MRCWVRSRFGRPLDMVVTPCPLPLLFMGSPSPRSDGEVLSVQLACVSLRRPSLTRGTQQILRSALPGQRKRDLFPEVRAAAQRSRGVAAIGV